MNVSNDKTKIKNLNIKTNLAFNWIIQILTYITPLLTAPYLARVLNPSGIGNYSYAYSIVQYMMLIVSFGFLDYGTKKIAETRSEKNDYQNVVWSIFWCRLFLFSFCMVVFGFGFIFTDYGVSNKKLLLILFLFVFSNVIGLNYFYRGFENYRILSICNLIMKVLNLVLIFLIVKNENDLLKYAAINVCSVMIMNFLLLLIAIKYIGKIRFNFNQIKNCFKEGFFYFLPTVATSVFTIVDITILGVLVSKEDVAYYEQASKIQTLISSLVISICPIMISRISILRKEKNYGEIENKMNQLANLIALLAFPCFFGIVAINKYFIPLFFGDEYMNSIDVLYYLAPQIICIPISYSICCAYYIPNEKINYITIFEFITAGINIVANVLILKFTNLNAVGVAITSFCSAVIMDILTIAFSFKSINYKSMLLRMIKPFIASSVMFIGIIILNNFISFDYIYMILIDISLGLLIYGIVVLILRDKLVFSIIKSIRK